METFRAALKKYEGTQRYHNFTSGKSAEDQSAQRYIISFEASDPFLGVNRGRCSSGIDGKGCTQEISTTVVPAVEWVCLCVYGQSFLLNQIRKMVVAHKNTLSLTHC